MRSEVPRLLWRPTGHLPAQPPPRAAFRSLKSCQFLYAFRICQYPGQPCRKARLQYLVLNATRDAQRHDCYRRSGEMWAHIGYLADDDHAADRGEAADHRHGLSPNDVESRIGSPALDLRPDLIAEPAQAFNVGPVIERSYEDTA